MKSARAIFKELGFNPTAPQSTQAAFLKHLRRDADRLTPSNLKKNEEPAALTEDAGEQQLSFDPALLRGG